ncbi:YhdT family protein [Chakrabartyella piscis]|uniref:YhdT family protein n=1 Tax=Chakrabartyella piscis TaxID=2918914 RepID=UPI002958A780|nr:YhdT family protein [Chakrabartyella piscis]
MEKMSYKEKFIQMNKEAKATWIATAIVFVFWWVSGFGIYAVAPEATILYMPAWFMVACFGTWFLTIGLVVYLTKKVFKDFDLNDDTEIEGGN